MLGSLYLIIDLGELDLGGYTKNRRREGPLSGLIGTRVIRDKDGNPNREYSELALRLSKLRQRVHEGTDEDMQRDPDALAESRDSR